MLHSPRSAARSLLTLLGLCIGAVEAEPVVAASAPAPAFAFGKVVSVNGSTFVVKSSFRGTTRSRTVSVSPSTTITLRAGGRLSDVKVGLCLSGNAVPRTATVMDSSSVTLTRPVKGSCGQAATLEASNLASAAGKIVAVNGRTITVSGPSGKKTVILGSDVQIAETTHVPASAITVGRCAFVSGTRTSETAPIKAGRISLSSAGKNGCSFGSRSSGTR
jgi:hypothetical protein